jgi:hypothetical protein
MRTSYPAPSVTENVALAAMCLMEEASERTLLANEDQWPGINRWRETQGSYALRSELLADAALVEAAWDVLNPSDGTVSITEDLGLYAFDFDFCPRLLTILFEGDEEVTCPLLAAQIVVGSELVAQFAKAVAR